MREIEKIGYTNPQNEHQSGLVIGRGGGTTKPIFGAMERSRQDDTES